MTIVVIATFLEKSLNHLVGIIYKIPQLAMPIPIRMRGRIPERNVLNIAVDGVKPTIFASLKNQFKDKNTSDEDPSFWTG